MLVNLKGTRPKIDRSRKPSRSKPAQCHVLHVLCFAVLLFGCRQNLTILWSEESNIPAQVASNNISTNGSEFVPFGKPTPFHNLRLWMSIACSGRGWWLGSHRIISPQLPMVNISIISNWTIVNLLNAYHLDWYHLVLHRIYHHWLISPHPWSHLSTGAHSVRHHVWSFFSKDCAPMVPAAAETWTPGAALGTEHSK